MTDMTLSTSAIRSYTIASRFCGPPTSGNGGYTAGLVANALGAVLGEAITVRLHLPPPLDTPLACFWDGSDANHSANALPATVRFMVDDDVIVVTGQRTVWPADVDATNPSPSAASLSEASAAVAPWATEDHPFPTCFVCGPDRAHGDGLRIFAGAISGRPSPNDVFAAIWEPAPVDADPATGEVYPEIVWAALDCPGGQAIHVFGGAEQAVVLGTITARRLAPVRSGERYVATAWEERHDGRKHFCTTVLHHVRPDGSQGEIVGESRALWIAIPRA